MKHEDLLSSILIVMFCVGIIYLYFDVFDVCVFKVTL